MSIYEKTSHKAYEKEYIGSSDMAKVILSGGNNLQYLMFGEDGSYNAYIVPETVEIPDYYTKVYETSSSLWIYDDYEVVTKFYGDKITVYRAGEFGCIIQIVNQKI